MQISEEQKQLVAQWIENGSKLSEIQDRLAKEFDLHLTYMDARLLVDDLRLTPKETVAPVAPAPAESAEAAAPSPAPADEPSPLLDEGSPGKTGGVSLNVDQITRAGALVSGKATFSDGQSAEWYLDQYGRLGFFPSQPGYRPSQTDLADFQAALDRELAKLGY